MQHLKEIYKKVKVYQSNPYFIIEMQNDACRFEVLLNDIQVFSHHLDGRVSWMRYPINSEISQSGKQILKLRLYPPMIDRTTQQLLPTLTEASKLKIRIMCGDKEDKMDSNRLVKTIETPTITDIDGKTISALNGLLFYELIDTISLEVPYAIEGWSKGQDLKKVHNFEQMVVAYYKELENIIKNNNYEELYKRIYKKELELQQSWYYDTAEGSNDRIDAYVKYLPYKDFKPIENYKMVISDDGKMVYLKSLSVVSFNRVGILSNVEGGYTYMPFYLYMPQGSDKLEIIR